MKQFKGDGVSAISPDGHVELDEATLDGIAGGMEQAKKGEISRAPAPAAPPSSGDTKKKDLSTP